MTIVMISFQSSSFFSWWPTQWISTWDDQPLFSLDPRIRVSLFGAFVSTLIWRVSTAGGDQTAILWEGNEPGEGTKLTYRELHRELQI